MLEGNNQSIRSSAVDVLPSREVVASKKDQTTVITTQKSEVASRVMSQESSGSFESSVDRD